MTTQWKYIIGLLVLVIIVIWLAVFSFPEAKLHLIACDVGQGDALLVTYGQTQILIDGGPNNKVLDCLSDNLPFWDREIELVVLTHPQTDHYVGLIEVFKKYNVGHFLANSLDSGSKEYEVLKNVVGGSGAKVINATTARVIGIRSIYLDIVHPTSDFIALKTQPLASDNDDLVLGTTISKDSPNDFSIVIKLTFGEFDALLTGDIGPKVMSEVINQLEKGVNQDIEYLKVPHHGSKNGLTKDLLEVVDPEVAVISVGKNSYGHPHEEVIKLLNDWGIKILRTDEMGDVEVISDGSNFLLRN